MNFSPPYALGWPTDSGWGVRSYTSSQFLLFKGFRIRGSWTVLGSGSDNSNHLAAFFTTDDEFLGNEVGLVLHLQEGKLRLYQCKDCNTEYSQNSSTIVMGGLPGDVDFPGRMLSYQIWVDKNGDFTFKAVDPNSYNEEVVVFVEKEAWMPNLFLTSGYINLSSHHNSDENWANSALFVGKVQLRR